MSAFADVKYQIVDAVGTGTCSGVKQALKYVPERGELVRWMSQKQMQYQEISLAGTKEFGILEEYEKLETEKCRPFNKVTIDGEVFIKEPLDRQGEVLAAREIAWYEKATQKNIDILPKIYEKKALKMELIKGRNIYECNPSYEEKKDILRKLVTELHDLHKTETVDTDYFSIKEAYINKTMDRLLKIQDLVPFAKEKEFIINGKKCRNIVYHKRELEQKLEQLSCEKYSFI